MFYANHYIYIGGGGGAKKQFKFKWNFTDVHIKFKKWLSENLQHKSSMTYYFCLQFFF